jgi:hypothetical protein
MRSMLDDRHRSSKTQPKWHKNIIVRADEFDIKPLEQSFQDGAFLDTQKQADRKVGQLLGVPAIEMHDYEKTRFDTAQEERKMFAESSLMPLMSRMQEEFQTQLIDRYFIGSPISTEKGADKPPPHLEKSFEKARGERDGNIILLIDADTMPIMGDVKIANTEYAHKLRLAYGMTPSEAAKFSHIELDPNPARDDIYMPTDEVNVTHPEKNVQVIVTQLAAEARAKEQANKPKPEGGGAAAASKRRCRPSPKSSSSESKSSSGHSGSSRSKACFLTTATENSGDSTTPNRSRNTRPKRDA